MPITIQSTTEANGIAKVLSGIQTDLDNTITELSTGLRINSPADDPADYAAAVDLNTQISGLSQASTNTQNGVALVQTANGALNSVNGMLQQIGTLADEYNGGTLNAAEQGDILNQIGQLTDQINSTAANTSFNGINLLNGGTLTFQTGPNDGDTTTASLPQLTGSSGLLANLSQIPTDLTSGSETTSSTMQSMMDSVSSAAAGLGATQNALTNHLSYLNTYSEGLQEADSTISDVNMAFAMTAFTSAQLREQASITMLAQSEQNANLVLKLLK